VVFLTNTATFHQSIENLLEFFKTMKLSKCVNFWGETRQIVDIAKLETEKTKKKEKRNLCQTSYHSKKKRQSAVETNKQTKLAKRKYVATRARIDVNFGAHARAVLALEKSKPRQGLRNSRRREGNLGWEFEECERGRIKECLS
jgi:hypothetical protein